MREKSLTQFCNQLQATEFDKEKPDDSAQRGIVFTPFLSMLPHSCVPNTFLQFKRDCVVLHAILPIKKGEQVIYGSS